MTPLDESYENIIQPHNFIKNFSDDEHFKEWCRKGSINDLKDTIRTFEHHELYRYCAIIQSVIDEKVDKMLSGFGFN